MFSKAPESGIRKQLTRCLCGPVQLQQKPRVTRSNNRSGRTALLDEIKTALTTITGVSRLHYGTSDSLTVGIAMKSHVLNATSATFELLRALSAYSRG